MHDHDHDHDDRHGAQASHDHPHARHADRPHPQHVVLEIGDGVGALIVQTDPSMHGIEVEISPSGADQERSHKEVLERTTGGGSAFVLVFDNLTEGDYTLWVDGVAISRRVRVEGGRIAELDWRHDGRLASTLGR